METKDSSHKKSGLLKNLFISSLVTLGVSPLIIEGGQYISTKTVIDLNRDGTITQEEGETAYRKIGKPYNPKTDPSFFDFVTNRELVMGYQGKF
ncbi:hypothetical protein HOE04_03500 [archaeon]|jgi:hypothetical protein|nr:hypothetical protein [archaeon]